jgi:hypothetical protein
VPRRDIPQSHKEEAVIKRQREEPAAPTAAVAAVPEVLGAVAAVPEAGALSLNRIPHRVEDIMEATV